MRLSRIKIFTYLILLLSCASQQFTYGQCVTTVNSFPYNESFESGPAGWVPSNSVHWEWGSPVGKMVITGAATGQECWVGGGLTAAPYASGISELYSPCFDLSSLSYPEISFKVFWETEFHFDGATLEYSTDGGTNWTPLGSDNSNDACAGIENWFNHASINKLQNKNGWSGNVQSTSGSCQGGNGSGQWVTARHNLLALTGQSNVKFRFMFGAGTQCNAFDGFAIDDIHIGEAAATTGDFTYQCGASNTAQFSNIHLSCQQGWAWDFGDAASGQDNFSTDENPTHSFSAPGTYQVSLVVYYQWGPPAVVPAKTITIINANTTVTGIRCFGENNASIALNVQPAGSYNITWNTNPVQTTSTISNLSPGVYTAQVTATNACSVSVPVTITQPAQLTVNPVATPAKCGNNNGTVSANAAGGTSPYTYSWTVSQTTPVITGLAAGSYGLTVTDANGCIASSTGNVAVPAVDVTLPVSLGNDTTICPGQTLLLNPGAFVAYQWQDHSTAPVYTVTKTGTYTVSVMDADGCSGTATVHVTVDCRGVFFPNAFTPNNDMQNLSYGPVGDLASITDYQLTIYNRYAEVVFRSADPYRKWNGVYKGKAQDTQSFVWTSTYTIRGQRAVTRKGTLLLLR